jgi:hypothetical protein
MISSAKMSVMSITAAKLNALFLTFSMKESEKGQIGVLFCCCNILHSASHIKKNQNYLKK